MLQAVVQFDLAGVGCWVLGVGGDAILDLWLNPMASLALN